ncbi:MAG: CPBP family intramembrane metalloprotease [Deltaproteobacteria bacterium]|nr:CPBP family intramembrane metalloprotease [Deltaproteobacteria bacterium]
MREAVLRLAIVFEGGLIVLAVALGWLLGSPPFARVSLSWSAVGSGLAATLLPLAGLWRLAHSRWRPFRRLMIDVQKIVGIFVGSSYSEIAFISLLAGLGEEGFFRGVVQSALAGLIGPTGALLIASALFGLGHFVTPTYALVAGVFGLYLGALLFVTGNLVPAIIVHALYDFFALIYLLRKLRLREGGGSV